MRKLSFITPITYSPNITIRTPPAFRMKSWYVISTCPIRLAEAPKATNTAVRPTIKNREFRRVLRSEEHTSELQSLAYLVCRLLLEKKKNKRNKNTKPRNVRCNS